MIRIITIAAALLLVAAAGSRVTCAQAIKKIDVIDFGIYRGKHIKQEDAPHTPAGVLGYVANLELVEKTAMIPALREGRFGLEFKIIGQTGATVRLKFIILIPQPGIQNGDTGNKLIRAEYFRDLVVGEVGYMGYKFDYPWEIVLGNWIFEIWDGDRRLALQSFNIIASV